VSINNCKTCPWVTQTGKPCTHHNSVIARDRNKRNLTFLAERVPQLRKWIETYEKAMQDDVPEFKAGDKVVLRDDFMSAKERVEGRNVFAKEQLNSNTVYEVQEDYNPRDGWIWLVDPRNTYNPNQFKKVVEKTVTLAPLVTYTNHTNLPATVTYYEDE
jgi:hypothetical protein